MRREFLVRRPNEAGKDKWVEANGLAALEVLHFKPRTITVAISRDADLGELVCQDPARLGTHFYFAHPAPIRDRELHPALRRYAAILPSFVQFSRSGRSTGV